MTQPPPKSGTDWLRTQMHEANRSAPTAPACAPDVAQSSQVESWLLRHGVRFSPLTQIPLAMIDVKHSRSNQARAEAVISESVERFTLALKNGESLPPTVVYKVGNKLSYIDGNNRDAAYRKFGAQFIPGYIIAEDTPSETIALMLVDANAHHGVTPSTKWRVMQAAHLVAIGHTQEVAAEAASITIRQLQDYQALLRADARAKQLKITSFTDLPTTARIYLGRISGDPVFHTAARCAIDTSMTSEDIRDLQRDVKNAADEAAALRVVADVNQRRKIEEQERKALGRGRTTLSSPKTSLATSVGKIARIDPVELARQILTDFDREIALKKIEECMDHLAELDAAIRRSAPIAQEVTG